MWRGAGGTAIASDVAGIGYAGTGSGRRPPSESVAQAVTVAEWPAGRRRGGCGGCPVGIAEVLGSGVLT
jgi:hypothetical protein